MVTIIKPGIDPATVVIDGRCTHCGCEFTFLPKEAEYQSDQRDGDFYKIKCPTCPKSVLTNVPRRSKW